jgi:hypothetical protein
MNIQDINSISKDNPRVTTRSIRAYALKGAAPQFLSEDIESTVRNIKIFPKLRGYINYSHQIAFEIEEKRVRKIIHRHKPWGVC